MSDWAAWAQVGVAVMAIVAAPNIVTALYDLCFAKVDVLCFEQRDRNDLTDICAVPWHINIRNRSRKLVRANLLIYPSSVESRVRSPRMITPQDAGYSGHCSLLNGGCLNVSVDRLLPTRDFEISILLSDNETPLVYSESISIRRKTLFANIHAASASFEEFQLRRERIMVVILMFIQNCADRDSKDLLYGYLGLG